jgi:hypothetical protein
MCGGDRSVGVGVMGCFVTTRRSAVDRNELSS